MKNEKKEMQSRVTQVCQPEISAEQKEIYIKIRNKFRESLNNPNLKKKPIALCGKSDN